MMPPGAPPFPPSNIPPGMNGSPAGFGELPLYINRERTITIFKVLLLSRPMGPREACYLHSLPQAAHRATLIHLPA